MAPTLKPTGTAFKTLATQAQAVQTATLTNGNLITVLAVDISDESGGTLFELVAQVTTPAGEVVGDSFSFASDAKDPGFAVQPTEDNGIAIAYYAGDGFTLTEVIEAGPFDGTSTPTTSAFSLFASIETPARAPLLVDTVDGVFVGYYAEGNSGVQSYTFARLGEAPFDQAARADDEDARDASLAAVQLSNGTFAVIRDDDGPSGTGAALKVDFYDTNGDKTTSEFTPSAFATHSPRVVELSDGRFAISGISVNGSSSSVFTFTTDKHLSNPTESVLVAGSDESTSKVTGGQILALADASYMVLADNKRGDTTVELQRFDSFGEAFGDAISVEVGKGASDFGATLLADGAVALTYLTRAGLAKTQRIELLGIVDKAEFAEQLFGSDFADRLHGDALAELYGLGGDDELTGVQQPEILFGDAGNDTITPGGGEDFVSGGAGRDLIIYDTREDVEDATIVGGAGRDRLRIIDDIDQLNLPAFINMDEATLSGIEELEMITTGGTAVFNAAQFQFDTVIAAPGGFVEPSETARVKADRDLFDATPQALIEIFVGAETFFSLADVTFTERDEGAAERQHDVDFAVFGDDDDETLIGSDRSDFLFGRGGDDVLKGGKGDDRLEGQDGIDTLLGGAGRDVLAVVDPDDEIDGIYNGGKGRDTLQVGEPGTTGNTFDFTGAEITSVETLRVSALTATLNFHHSQFNFDTLDATDLTAIRASNLRVMLDDTETFDLSDLTILGDAFTYVVTTIGNDDDQHVVFGPDINVIFAGHGGDDFVETVANEFTNLFIGGDGVDTISYRGSAEGVVIDLNDTIRDDGIDTIDEFEIAIGSQFDDTIIGAGFENQLFGLRGNDDISTGGGVNHVNGGKGDDRITFSFGTEDNGSVLDGGKGTDTLFIGDAADGSNSFTYELTSADVKGIERLEVDATGGANVLFRASQFTFDEVEMSGNDAGEREVIFLAMAELTHLDLSDLTMTYSEEDFFGLNIKGDADDETIIGTREGDNIFAGGGDDFVEGGAGSDLMEGGEGIDTLSYASSDGGVIVDLGEGSGSGSDAQEDRIIGFENLIGSSHADLLVGDTGTNLIKGGAGADGLGLTSGGDRLLGGAGDDGFALFELIDIAGTKMIGGKGQDVFAIVASEVEFAAIDFTGVTFKSVEELMFVSKIGLDLSFSATQFGFTSIVADAEAKQDPEAVARNITITMGEESELDLSGITFADLDPDFFGFTLQGDAEAETLIGSSMNDLIIGGAGPDQMTGGKGIDTVSYESSTEGVNVVLNRKASGGDAQGDRLKGFENLIGSDHADTLTGTKADNEMSGGAGDDAIFGKGGIDQLLGGEGADQFLLTTRFDNAGSTLDGGADEDTLLITGADGKVDLTQMTLTDIEHLRIEPGAGGTLEVVLTDAQLKTFSSVTRVGSEGAVDIIVVGIVASSLPKPALADQDRFILQAGDGAVTVLTGSSGDDILRAGPGTVLILAGDGDDQVEVGSANTQVIGGEGDDLIFLEANGVTNVISYQAGGGKDVVTGFEGDNDVVSFLNPIGPDNVFADAEFEVFFQNNAQFNAAGTRMTLDFGDGDILVLQNEEGFDQSTLSEAFTFSD